MLYHAGNDNLDDILSIMVACLCRLVDSEVSERCSKKVGHPPPWARADQSPIDGFEAMSIMKLLIIHRPGFADKRNRNASFEVSFRGLKCCALSYKVPACGTNVTPSRRSRQDGVRW